MSKSTWTRLCLIGLITCCAVLCHAQGENINHCSTFNRRMDCIPGFASSGDYAYVLGRDSANEHFISTYDVSDIMSVHLISTTTLEIYNGTCYRAILVYEDRLFVFSDFGLVIYDISQPTSPVQVCILDIDGDYQGAAFYEDHLITLYSNTITVWDIISYSQPQMEDSLFVSSNSYSLYLIGSNAFIGNNGSNYSVVDLTDPTNLQLLGINQNSVHGILAGVSGSNLLFNWDSTAVVFYDASVVLEPVLLGSVYSPGTGAGVESSNLNFAVQGAKLAVSYSVSYTFYNDERYYNIYDISNPADPVLMQNGSFDFYESDNLYLADDGHRMILKNHLNFNFLDFHHSQLIGENIPNSAIRQIAANDTHVFTSNWGYGVTSFNISDPLAPVKEDQILIPDLHAMCLEGNLLVTSQCHLYGDSGYIYTTNIVKLHDVSNPNNIHTISTLNTDIDQPTCEIRITGDKLVLFNGFAGVRIYDISNTAEPTLVLSLPGQGKIISGILEGNYLYYGSYLNNHIDVYDIVSYSSPVLISTIPVNHGIKRIQLRNSLLCVGGESSTIKMFNVSDPAAPTAFEGIPVSAYVQDFILTNDALIVLHYDSLAVYGIRGSLMGLLAGTHPVEDGAKCLALSDYYVLVGTEQHAALYDCSAALLLCGSSVEDQQQVPSALRLSCYPNPFREKVNISFDLPESGMLKLDIYNIRGQKVKSLDPVYSGKGVNTVYWDAQADLSSALPAGIYILKAKSGSHSASARIVLLK